MSLQTFFDDREVIAAKLQETGDLSLVNTFATDLPRVFIVATASSFEVEVTNHIIEYFRVSSDQAGVAAFAERKALKRTYHTLFNWETNNVKPFFQYFGNECATHFGNLLATHDWLEGAGRSFLALGRARNELVHGDFSTFSPTMTADEVKSRYTEASKFVDAIPKVLRLEAL
jgi:hypothetical protein